MTKALMVVPVISEGETAPQGWSRRTWTSGGKHYSFVMLLNGPLKWLARQGDRGYYNTPLNEYVLFVQIQP